LRRFRSVLSQDVDKARSFAGYGHEDLVLESTMEELHQFEVNIFGPVAVMQSVLPYMRKRRSDHIHNITSMGGIITMPGIAFHHASKFALEGISESLGGEIKSVGIHVTGIEPGGFRIDWAGRSMLRAERSLADCDEVFEPRRQRRLERNGNQPGDPKKAAAAMLRLIASDNPPAHLLLGGDAISLVPEKLGYLKTEFDAREQVSSSTDFE